MNPQFQRIMLFAALGLVLVMIWQKWGEFQARYTGELIAATEAPPADDRSVDVPATPTIADTRTNTDTSTNTTAKSTSETPTVAGAAPPTARLIRVTTDLIKAEIDPLGGDLVRVELLQHPVNVDTPNMPFVLMHNEPRDLFVAQNGLIGADAGREYPNHNVEYTVEQWDYQLDHAEQVEVVLHWRAADGVAYEKIFRFTRDHYDIEIDFKVTNQSAQPWRGFIYGQLKQTEIESTGSLGFLGRLPSYNGAAIYTEADKYDKIDYGDIEDENLAVATDSGWVAMLQHYFVTAWLPTGANHYQFYSGFTPDAVAPQYRIGYKTVEPTTIPIGASEVIHSALYAGPKEQIRLDRQSAPGLKLTVDYGFLTPIANPLFWLLQKIHSFTNNWGWAIILLTLLVKLVFYPLSAASFKSMARMKKLQPRMATLKERYADDKQKFQQEMMKLYKAEKVNPAGGCLPVLVQIPVFIALYWVLLESVELRQAHFLGWLTDLSVPDPYYVLPILMGASMIAQHMLNPAPVDPLQKKIMMALPFVFTILFLWFPAGLVLYWVVNNLLTITQQYYVMRKFSAPKSSGGRLVRRSRRGDGGGGGGD